MEVDGPWIHLLTLSSVAKEIGRITKEVTIRLKRERLSPETKSVHPIAFALGSLLTSVPTPDPTR